MIIIISLVSMALLATAQSGNKTSAVFLKTGDVYFGKIESDDHGNIKLANECGLFQFSSSEIDSTILKYRRPLLSREKGYYNYSSIGFLFGESNDVDRPIPSLTFVNGWQFNKRLFNGLGIGYEHYNWGVIPIFVQSHYMLGSEKLQPFGSFKIGYSFPAEKPQESDYYNPITKYNGGIMLNPEVGIKISTGRSSSLLISLGYHFQQLSKNENPVSPWSYMLYDYERVIHTDINRVSFRIGFIFL
jgi:hypothetical protein